MARSRFRLWWLLGLLASSPALAGERVDEIYRTTFGAAHYLEVDETDSSVWMLSGANLLHLAPDGSVLSVHSPRVPNADQLLRHPTDGSYWVSGGDSGTVAHFTADGQVLWRNADLPTGPGAEELGLMYLDPADNSLTVFVAALNPVYYHYYTGVSSVMHINSSGAVEWTASVDSSDGRAALNVADGSVWVIGPNALRHYRADGYLLYRGEGAYAVRDAVVNPADGSFWYSCYHCVVHLAASGAELNRYEDLQNPTQLALDAHGGSAWVIDLGTTSSVSWQPAAVHLAADATLLGRYTNLQYPEFPQVSEAPPGSVWVCDSGYDPDRTPAVVHLAADGSELYRATDFTYPFMWARIRADGAAWIYDGAYPSTADSTLRRVTAEGQEAFRMTAASCLWPLSIDPRDASGWFADALPYDPGYGVCLTPTHVGTTGEVLWQHRGLRFERMAGNAHTGGCWVVDTATGEVVSLSPEGAEQWRFPISLSDGSPPQSCSLSADSPDGSGWVGVNGYGGSACSGAVAKIYHVAEDGTELWSLPNLHGAHVLGSRSDGSCWVGEQCAEHGISRLTKYAADGTRLWTLDNPPAYPSAANPADGSTWAVISAGPSDLYLVHLSADGAVLSSTATSAGGALAVNPRDGSVWAYDYTSHGLVHFSETGELLLRTGQLVQRYHGNLAVDAADGSVWLSDVGEIAHGGMQPSSVHAKVLHLAPDGTELWRSTNFNWPEEIWANPYDHTVWVNDYNNNQLVRLGVVHSPFLDVDADYWAFDYIRACLEAGIVGGYPDGTYHPTAPVTRDQMAVFISRALAGGDANVPPGPGTATFPDVPAGYWAYRYVEYAVDHGVAGGYPDGTYLPTVTVTRDQMAVFVARAMTGSDAAVPTGPATATFPDMPTSQWAFRYVEYIKSEGVTGGYPDGTYRPAVAVTRDQMAVYVARAVALPM